MVDAAARAARRVDGVRDRPADRRALAAQFYLRSGGPVRRYAAAELSFIRWELARGVLAPVDAGSPGSAWWRAVNERLLRDKAEARFLAARVPGEPSSAAVAWWLAFLREPRPASWYRAHNASIVAGYLAHEDLADDETQVERFMMNVALLRVLFAHALVAQPRLALGPLAAVGPALADPRGPTVALFLDLRRSFPSHYPLRLSVEEAITREQPLARALDYGVIAPRLPELYDFSADVLAEPRVVDLLDDGAPAYAWRRADRSVWSVGSRAGHLRAMARLTGARDGFDRQFG